MSPSPWKLYLDDFPFFGFSLAYLEPEPELFEVDEIGDDGDDDLSYHLIPNFKSLFPSKSCLSYCLVLLFCTGSVRRIPPINSCPRNCFASHASQ